MKKISVDEMKRIQIQILDSVDSYCRAANLHYSLFFGTLLGAIRHKGYIPWDDDIDIALPREDYEKFVSGYKDGYYKVYDYRNDLNYDNPYAKVADTRTVLEEDINMENIGINIDVFPIDNLFDTIEESLEFIKSLAGYKRRFRMKLLKPTKKNVWWKRVAINLSKIFVMHTSMKRETINEYKKIATLNNKHSRYVGMPVDPEQGAALRSVVGRTIFDDYTSVLFEGKEYMAIANYDKWLTQMYGDYMTPPSGNDRTSPHTLSNIYWK